MWFYRPNQLPERHKAVILFFCGLPSFLYLWSLRSTSIRIDDSGITSSECWVTKSINWADVEDVVSSERLLVVRDSAGKALKIFHGEFLSIGAFEDLRRDILDHAMPRLQSLWGGDVSSLVVPYPRISVYTWIVYSIPLVYGVLVVWIRFAGSILFQLGGAVVVALIVVPFLVRDVLNARRTLALGTEGLSCKGDGRKVAMRWEEIDDIIVKEPLTVGYGKIVVRSRSKGKIAIPRSIKKCGQILHVLQTRTGITPSQGFDY